MHPKADIEPVSTLQRRSRDLLRRAGETRRPVVITVDGQAKGVLVDFDSYRELRESIALLKLVGMAEQDIKAGRTVELDTAFDEVERAIPAVRTRRKR